jgi:ABC-type phosphate transport system auxiliary subunit
MNATQLITYLNAIDVGELDGIRAKLEQARIACIELRQTELAEHLDDAARALADVDLERYRKRLQTVIARLGHVK